MRRSSWYFLIVSVSGLPNRAMRVAVRDNSDSHFQTFWLRVSQLMDFDGPDGRKSK